MILLSLSALSWPRVPASARFALLSLFFFCLVFSCSCLFSFVFFFFSSRRRHTRLVSDWSSDVCSSDLCWSQWQPPRPSTRAKARPHARDENHARPAPDRTPDWNSPQRPAEPPVMLPG